MSFLGKTTSVNLADLREVRAWLVDAISRYRDTTLSQPDAIMNGGETLPHVVIWHRVRDFEPTTI